MNYIQYVRYPFIFSSLWIELFKKTYTISESAENLGLYDIFTNFWIVINDYKNSMFFFLFKEVKPKIFIRDPENEVSHTKHSRGQKLIRSYKDFL